MWVEGCERRKRRRRGRRRCRDGVSGPSGSYGDQASDGDRPIKAQARAKHTLQAGLRQVKTSSIRSWSQKTTPILRTNLRKLPVVLVKLSSSLRELSLRGPADADAGVDLGRPAGTTAERRRSENCVVKLCEGRAVAGAAAGGAA
jgi:hypothetical protein